MWLKTIELRRDYSRSSGDSREAKNEKTNPWLCGAQTVQLSVYWTKANSDGKRCQSEERRLLSHITTYSIYPAHYCCMRLTLVVGNVNVNAVFQIACDGHEATPGLWTHPVLCRSYWSGRSQCGPASRLRTGPLWSGWGWTGWRAAPPESTELLWLCSSEDVLP